LEIYTEKDHVETDEEGLETTTKVKENIEYEIHDLDNGQYTVNYTVNDPCEVFLDIKYTSEVQKPDTIRGGPFRATFTADAPEANNKFAGPTMKQYIKSLTRLALGLIPATRNSKVRGKLC
jgi:hypothetical protein